jgi:anti-sigma factor RsiW
MKNSCSSVLELLEKYFDREATDRERSLVEAHLAGCSACQDTLAWMGEARNLVKAPVEAAVQKEDFERAWLNIRREIRLQEKPSWRESIRSWLDLSLFIRKKVWVPAVAAAAILLLLTTQVFF